MNFGEQKDVGGIKFTALHAGHVLGACMYLIEIAGVKILYTGDFSREDDRHLRAARAPPPSRAAVQRLTAAPGCRPSFRPTSRTCSSPSAPWRTSQSGAAGTTAGARGG